VPRPWPRGPRRAGARRDPQRRRGAERPRPRGADSDAVQQVLARVALGEHARALAQLEGALACAHCAGPATDEHEDAPQRPEGRELALLDGRAHGLDGVPEIETTSAPDASRSFLLGTAEHRQPASWIRETPGDDGSRTS